MCERIVPKLNAQNSDLYYYYSLNSHWGSLWCFCNDPDGYNNELLFSSYAIWIDSIIERSTKPESVSST